MPAKSARDTDAVGAVGEDSPALRELLAAKEEFVSIKARAFRELKLFSRKLLGVMLLCDDLAGLASIDEAAAKVRQEHAALLAERDMLAAGISEMRSTTESLRSKNAEATTQLEQVTERVEALEREERRLKPTVEKFQAIEQSIEASQRLLDELRAEENRLKPIVREHHEIEKRLPERQQALADVERRLAAIRQSI